MTYTDQQIFETIRASIAKTLRIPPETVGMDSGLAGELGLDSLDFVDISFQLESQFKITFYQGNIIDKLSEFFGAASLSQQGRLSELGAVVLRRRMPEVEPSRIFAGMSVFEIEDLYTPATWVRVIGELIEARPKTCTACGWEDLKPARRSVLVCSGCKTELACPTQEQLLEIWARRVSDEFLSPGSMATPEPHPAGNP